MSQPPSPERLAAVEHAWCLQANGLCARRLPFHYFATVSRLGDGVFWYLLMALLIAAVQHRIQRIAQATQLGGIDHHRGIAGLAGDTVGIHGGDPHAEQHQRDQPAKRHHGGMGGDEGHRQQGDADQQVQPVHARSPGG